MAQEFLTQFIITIAKAQFIQEINAPVLIARDTRQSGKTISTLFSSLLNKAGVDVVDLGVLPTPGMSHALQHGTYSVGLMITASHNPASDNGIKLFASTGEKLTAAIEKKLEQSMQLPGLDFIAAPERGITSFPAGYFSSYLDSVFGPEAVKAPEGGMVVDCSNGSFSWLGSSGKFNQGFTFTAMSPTGHNINENCGALHPSRILLDMENHNASYGVAFDGDGDRAVFASRDYGVIEAEKLALVFYEILAQQKPKAVVASAIANTSFLRNIEHKGGRPVLANVGDRNVVATTLEEGAVFGFEPSGHFFFADRSLTMDGAHTLNMFLYALDYYGPEFSDELRQIKFWNRHQLDIPVQSKENETLLINIENQTEAIIDPRAERFLVRESIWDPIIRVYYDYEKIDRFGRIKPVVKRIINQYQEKPK
jgi:phosphoglucosamine mutase